MLDSAAVQVMLEKIGYTFSQRSILTQSLTHKSYDNENPGSSLGHNERMEFLGDAVLDLIVSEMLMDADSELSEGDLSKVRASLVSEGSLAEVAQEIGIGECLLMGRGEENSGGRTKSSILSDGLEALFAAIYLDSRMEHGIREVERVIQKLFENRIHTARNLLGKTDFKTELQELVQKRYKETVKYMIVGEEGPDHDKRFVAAVSFQGKEFGRGEGNSKKQAEQEAAQQALGRLH